MWEPTRPFFNKLYNNIKQLINYKKKSLNAFQILKFYKNVSIFLKPFELFAILASFEWQHMLQIMVVFLYCQPSKPSQPIQPSKPKTRFFIVSQVSQFSQNVSQLKLAYLAEIRHMTQCFDFTFCLFFVKIMFQSLNVTFWLQYISK